METSRKIKVCWVTAADMTLKFMLFSQLTFLKKQGYDLYVVSSPGKWVEVIKKQGIKTKTIKIKRKISPFSDIILFLKLFFYFKKEKFDIVHTHTFKPDFYGQIAAKLARTPIIIRTSHGFPFGEDSSFLKKKFYIFLERLATKCSDIFLSISHDIIKTSIKEKIGRPDSIRYLGRDIDTERFNPQSFSEEFILNKKRKLGISRRKKVIGIVARLVKQKGYPELFDAFKNVISKFSDVVLLVIGPEEPEKKDAVDPSIVVKYGIEKNVIFLGERADVEKFYAVMDIFVLPTHMEGLGASILEASAMEKPVIATDTGGCSETIDDEETGILVPLKNSQKLAKAIIYLFKNPEKARKMGKKGRKKVVNEFNTEIILKRLGEEYQRIIEKKLKSFDEKWFLKYSRIAKKKRGKRL